MVYDGKERKEALGPDMKKGEVMITYAFSVFYALLQLASLCIPCWQRSLLLTSNNPMSRLHLGLQRATGKVRSGIRCHSNITSARQKV